MMASLTALAIVLSSLTGTLLLLQKQRAAVIHEMRHLSEARLAGTPIVLEYAETSWQKMRGLSGRDTLPEGHGMLFIYEKPGDYGIWMKDMRFPIDILWFDEHKRLVSIHEDVAPGSYPQVFRSQQEAHYVLEVPTGFVAEHGIALGDILTFPLPHE